MSFGGIFIPTSPATNPDPIPSGSSGVSFTEEGGSFGINNPDVSLTDAQLGTAGFNEALDRWGVLSNAEWNTLSDASRQTLYNGYRGYLKSKSNNDTDLWRLQRFMAGALTKVRESQDLTRARAENRPRGLIDSIFAGSATVSRANLIDQKLADDSLSNVAKTVAQRTGVNDTQFTDVFTNSERRQPKFSRGPSIFNPSETRP